MQRRMVRKLDLEKLLTEVEPHPSPKASLEQYTIPPDTAAEILYLAAYTYNSIIGKTVLDLGCGTGRLAIGAAFLGAKQAIGVDIDKTAVETAKKNAEKLGFKEKTRWIAADIEAVRGKFDTVIQNPPFGVQKRKADTKFLKKALELGKMVYSLHKRGKEKPSRTEVSPRSFLTRFISNHGGKIKAIIPMQMTIPYMFEFHKKPKHRFLVDLYVIEK